jgi:hypothetical protein
MAISEKRKGERGGAKVIPKMEKSDKILKC